MDDTNQTRRMRDEIYVGYLPVPERLRLFLRRAVPISLWLLCIVTYLCSRTQRDPGNGVWETGVARRFIGTVIAHPYPMLLADDAGDGRPGLLLLVEIGKHGGGQRAMPHAGQRLAVSGWLVHRDVRRMLELEPGDAAFEPANDRTPAEPPTPTPVGRITLRGEIVDSKCFLGVMKPGDGKTHKSCATLCIAGGIPPMFVTRDAKGLPSFYLITNEAGAALDPAAMAYIGDRVEATGDVFRRGDLAEIRLRASDIHRE